MLKKRQCIFLIGLLLFAANVACNKNSVHAVRNEGVRNYDVYIKGIHAAELVISERGGTSDYSIKKKDWKSSQWSASFTSAGSEIERRKEFRLWGAVEMLPAQLEEIEKIDWSWKKAVAWPDEDSIYIRQRELAESVNGKTYKANCWKLKDASSPMDLLIDSENRLIAGIDAPLDICMVLRGFENFTTLKNWLGTEVSAAKWGYRFLGKSMVEMSDGVKLATLVYLPSDGTDGPYPVVFIRTPYGITPAIEAYWHYCARGYAFVIQACRGTAYWDPDNKSEGEWELVINEPRDGADALTWIAAQPWCDGNIGMQGGSYVRFTQWACSMANNPALKCVVPESSMGTVFSDMQYMGGGFVEGLMYYVLFMQDQRILPTRSWPEILHFRPLIEMDTYATGKDNSQWNTLVDHWINDDYWKQQDFYRGDHPRNFASFQISGWFDDDFPGTRRNWELMKRHGTKPQKLILGPWKHGYNRDRKLNGFSFGLDALRDDIWLIKQQWYDRFLRGIDNGVDEPAVEYFVLGDNEWRTASQWPPEEAEVQKWYFHSNGKANKLPQYGDLTETPPSKDEPSDVYTYNPLDPVPNWYSFELMQRWEDVQSFPYDFKDIEMRGDVAVYTSEPVKEDLTVAGDLMAILYASCDVRDTDWWVYLSDVYPDGMSVRLTTGMLRARFRNLEDKQHHIFGSNFEKEEFLSGKMSDVVRYDINIPSIAVTFKKGHRIRIAVMNACDSYSFPNSNTGENEAYVDKTVEGTMAIHHNPLHPSHVLLSVLRR
ncbi:MAG: CocE/NonD family hydrolase [Candidatus Aminicenantes bacterium]|nr:CocE/NonD family hydrolase [Candidatus Aminicenantes bacterium]